MKSYVLLLSAIVALAACGDDTGDASTDASTADRRRGPPVCDPATAPAPRDPCITDPCGNEVLVGRTCTVGGGECGTDLETAFLCVLDRRADEELNICTRTCTPGDPDGRCGSNAVCAGDPANPAAGFGCVPAGCVDDEPDGGAPIDGGSSDAGTLDAGSTDAGSTDAG